MHTSTAADQGAALQHSPGSSSSELALYLRCPHCGSRKVRRDAMKGLRELLMRFLTNVRAHHCGKCRHRWFEEKSRALPGWGSTQAA